MKTNWKWAACFCAACVMFTACDDDNSDIIPPTDEYELTGTISEDLTLEAGQNYTLSGGVHVTAGATLTIPAGVTITAVYFQPV